MNNMKILKGHMDREQFARFLGDYLQSSVKPEEGRPPENPLDYVNGVEGKDVIYAKFGYRAETIWHLAGEVVDGRKIIRGTVEGRSFEWVVEGDKHG